MSDNIELRRKQNNYICRNLPDNILPISPVKMFECEDDDSRREEILQVCFELIDMCDEAWFYLYGNSNIKTLNMSAGQLDEYNYACKHLIKHTDWQGETEHVKFKKPPKRCIQMDESEGDTKKVTYKCGCEASGDNVASYCPMHDKPQVNEGWI